MLPIVGLPATLDIRQSPSLGRGWNSQNDSYQAETAKRNLRTIQDVIWLAETAQDFLAHLEAKKAPYNGNAPL
jgi:hypothetical protein